MNKNIFVLAMFKGMMKSINSTLNIKFLNLKQAGDKYFDIVSMLCLKGVNYG